MKKHIFSLLIGFGLASCDFMLLPETPSNDPVSNFNLLWKDFDILYGGFEAKAIDWDELYIVYRPKVTDQSTDHQLYEAITGMLEHLNDNHVFLYPTRADLEPYNSGILGDLETFDDFSLSVVKDKYLTDAKKYEKSIFSGFLDGGIGYLHFSDLNESAATYSDVMGKVMKQFKNTRGIVIDVRANEGGYDQASIQVAGHFADSKQLAFKFRLRNGPSHGDFTAWKEYYVREEGKAYTNPVIVLTHRFTVSAAETFVLAMARYDHVTVLGDTTSGAFSDVIRRELPNGWAYGVSVGEWRDFQGRSYEGIGYPPDVLIENEAADVKSGRDEALEKAIELIKGQ